MSFKKVSFNVNFGVFFFSSVRGSAAEKHSWILTESVEVFYQLHPTHLHYHFYLHKEANRVR